METKLKQEGKYEEYEKRMLNGNKNSILEDLEQALDAWINNTETFMTEDGVAEDWSKVKINPEDFTGIKEEIKKAKEQEI
jgi:alcohol dehydrogenase YqhD (iron-dependent ADH family)